MEVLILLCYLILVWYLLNIFWLVIGFTKVKTFHSANHNPKATFSIVVPFRNEAENLPKLLASIEKLNYPTELFEVILVDDSSDEPFQVSSFKFQVSLFDSTRKTKSPKKDAINTAISQAKNEWIITTDADCIVPENWLTTFDAFIQKNNPKMIASGVIYRNPTTFLSVFQQMDLLSLQGTTIGSFGNRQAFMCNGANFCYRKDFFETLNGFEGNETIASGDDVFLLQKAIEKEQVAVNFLKSNQTIVYTRAETNWSSLFNQRIRWASKTANYKTLYSKQLALSVFTLNLMLLLNLASGQWKLFLVLFSIKFWIDFALLSLTSSFFKTKSKYLLFSSLVYPFFSVIVVFYTFFGKYTWKGRVFKK
ncbi:MAG: glycosyltransferase [Bacteroidota bacterium]